MPKPLENFNDALKFAMKLIGLRRRSEAEIRSRLQERGTDEELEARVIEELYRFRYLDDESFAESYINDRIRFRPSGSLALRNELKRKGIRQDIIELKLEELFDEEKELATAESLTEKKLKTARTDDKKKLKAKMIFYLKSRGFSSQIIDQALRSTLE